MYERYFDTRIDHYNFYSPYEDTTTFPLRYFVSILDDDDGNDDVKASNNNNESAVDAVFFYAGNEADIVQFVNNTGFMFELAAGDDDDDDGSGAYRNAMVVFAEHRYYGRSMPFGSGDNGGDFSSKQRRSVVPGYNVSLLTVEQAMADYDALAVHLRSVYKLSDDVPFVLFGGSYGANLAMWLRLRNPNLWAGAVASSATPLKHLLRETNGFASIETEAYGNVSSECPALVRRGWKELYGGAKTEGGREDIRQRLHLCPGSTNRIPSPLRRDDVDGDDDSGEAIAEIVHGWIGNALETMVQYGYPYTSRFYNPLPGYPFKVACERMLLEAVTTATKKKKKRNDDRSNNGTTSSTGDSGSGLDALYAAANVYYNYSGQAGPCFDWDSDVRKEAARYWQRLGQHHRVPAERQPSARVSSSAGTSSEMRRMRHQPFGNDEGTVVDWTARAWGYQTCTEVYQPMPTDGVSDFEVPHQPNRTAYFERCRSTWGVEPRPDWEERMFMGADIGTGTNLFLTNGQLDPWRAAGIQTQPKGSAENGYMGITVRTIENGAHHLDLRASNPLDPPSVVRVRQEQRLAIRRWIQQWRKLHS